VGGGTFRLVPGWPVGADWDFPGKKSAVTVGGNECVFREGGRNQKWKTQCAGGGVFFVTKKKEK